MPPGPDSRFISEQKAVWPPAAPVGASLLAKAEFQAAEMCWVDDAVFSKDMAA